MFKNKKINFLAIGDIASDTFIKISEAETECDNSGDNCKICLNYGGKIPYEKAITCYAVGNSANFAVGTRRLGMNAILMTNLGDDMDGKLCVDNLKKENIDTNLVQIENNLSTNCHYVIWYKKDRTILVKHEKYNYKWPDNKKLDKNLPSWVYLSSLGENSLPFHNEVLTYLNKHPDIKFAFQPGTFEIRFGTKSLADIYKRTNILFCNRSEAEKILNIEESDINKLLKGLYNLGPKMIVVTDGASGAYAYDGDNIFYQEAYPLESLVEVTGAGDAFTSAFMSAIELEKDIQTALKWGSINAISVISHIGPQEGLLTRENLNF